MINIMFYGFYFCILCVLFVYIMKYIKISKYFKQRYSASFDNVFGFTVDEDKQSAHNLVDEIKHKLTSNQSHNEIWKLFYLKFLFLFYPDIEKMKTAIHKAEEDSSFFNNKPNEKYLLSTVEHGKVTKLNREELLSFQSRFDKFIGYLVAFCFPIVLFLFLSLDIEKTWLEVTLGLSFFVIYIMTGVVLFAYIHGLSEIISYIDYHRKRYLGDILEHLSSILKHYQDSCNLQPLEEKFYNCDNDTQHSILNNLEDLVEFFYYYTITEQNDSDTVQRYIERFYEKLYDSISEDSSFDEIKAIYDLRKNDYENKYNEKTALL